MKSLFRRDAETNTPEGVRYPDIVEALAAASALFRFDV